MSDYVPGVFYATADHVGLFRRLLIDAVDGVVLLLIWLITFVVLVLADIDKGIARTVFMLVTLASFFFYLVFLKYIARTLGYVLFDARLVNLQGAAPSVGALIIRALFLFIGPANTLLDLLWVTSDPHRQAIRDKFARTYVIRSGSRPAGNGHIRYVRLDMLGLQFLFPEVSRDSKVADEPAGAP